MKCPMNREECMKEECSLWIEFFVGDPKDNKKEAKCSLAWGPFLQIEQMELIKKILPK